jgi:hypothetical protein
MIEVLRQKSIECNGDFPDFEKAQTLFSHLTDMLRVLLLGGATQEGIYDVYEDLMAILRNHVPCVHTNLPIPPYDLGDYAVSQFPIDAAFCQNVGDGVNTVYSVTHNLNDDCVLVQVYEVTSGAQVLTDVTVTSNNSVNVSFAAAPATDAYKVVVHSGNGGMKGDPGEGVPAGGTIGQFLVKGTLADYDTQWITPSFVPNARTLTINGTTQDLSADRTFTIPSTNIYNSNGTLTENRVVDGGGFGLRLNPNMTFGGDVTGVVLRPTADASYSSGEVGFQINIQKTFDGSVTSRYLFPLSIYNKVSANTSAGSNFYESRSLYIKQSVMRLKLGQIYSPE